MGSCVGLLTTWKKMYLKVVVTFLPTIKKSVLVLFLELWSLKHHKQQLPSICSCSVTHIPAASIKGRLRRKVRRGSLRFLRKSFRRPVMAWMSSTLLSTGTVLLRRNFSFSSFTVRSAPDRRYRPAWEGTHSHLFLQRTYAQLALLLTIIFFIN